MRKFLNIKIGLTVDLVRLSNSLSKIGLRLYWTPVLRGVVLKRI